MEKGERNGPYRIGVLFFRRAVGALLALGVLLALAVALVVAVVPALAGASTYTVLSPSMVPTLAPGTVVVVRPRPAVAVGDVVTFIARDPDSSATRVVTHRVVAVEPGPALRTRGDANADDDPGLVAAADVRGVLWYSVPWVGRAAEALRSPAGLLVGGGVVLLLGASLLLPRTVREGAGSAQ